MSGRPAASPIAHWSVSGVVEKGDQRGRTLGMPTANLPVERHAGVPPEGVYAGVVVRADGTRHPAAVSLGRRPTFYADSHELCEAHLLDFSGDLYGEEVTVVLTHFLRGQERFDGLDALIAQMRADCDAARDAVTGLV